MNGKVPVSEFARRIKEKYPDYAGIDDNDLAKRMVAKYPDYAEQVDFGLPQVQQTITQAKPGELPSPYGPPPASPWEQAKTFGRGVAKDVGTMITAPFGSPTEPLGAAGAVGDLIDKATRLVSNPLMRFFDPTAALGGSVWNLEEGRPFESDPQVRSAIETTIQSIVPTITGLPKFMTAEEVSAAVKAGKLSYQDAQAFVKAAPLVKEELAYEAGKLRRAVVETAKSTERAQKVAAERGLKDVVVPMEQEIAQLEKAKAATGEALAKQELEASITSARTGRGVRAELPVAKQAATEATATEAGALAETMGPPVMPTEMTRQASEARLSSLQAVQKRIGNLYDNIRATVAQTGLNVSGVKTAAMVKDYDTYKGIIQAAANRGSPGAKFLIETMELESDAMTGAEALKTWQAANEVGYGRPDALMIETRAVTESQRLARMVAQSYSAAFKRAVGTLPEDLAKTTLGQLDEAQQLLQARKATFWSASSRRGMALEKRGQVEGLLRDPAAFTAEWQVLDESTRAATKRQVFDSLLDDFPTKWAELHPEIKATAFTPEQIANGDRIATQGAGAVERITQEYNLRKELIARAAEDRKVILFKQKEQLGQLTQNINELNDKIAAAKGAAKAGLQVEREDLAKRVRTARHALDAMQHQNRVDMLQKTERAQLAIERTKRMRKVAWYGLAALGLWKARSAVEAVMDSLGVTRGGW